jgi:hypothetical protein
LDFIDYRKKKAPMTPKAIELMIKELNKLPDVSKIYPGQKLRVK